MLQFGVVPPEHRAPCRRAGDDEDGCGDTERAKHRQGVLEDTGIPVIECDSRQALEGPARDESISDFAQGYNVAMAGEPLHLALEPWQGHVNPSMLDLGILCCRDDVVITKDYPRVPEQPGECREAESSETAVAEPGKHPDKYGVVQHRRV